MDSEPQLFARHGEKTPLLGEQVGDRQKIEVKPMLYRDLPRAVETVQKILPDEAFMNYLSEADTAPFYGARWRVRNGLIMAEAIDQERMLTVNGGESILRYGMPGDSKRKISWVGKIIKWLSYLVALPSALEAKKRRTECLEKIGALTKAVFGDSIDGMYEVRSLATDPEAQGQGFASALVTAVTDMGDADGRDVWLLTSTAYKFYEALGFVIVGEDTIGGDNPTWKHEPVALRIMLRKAKASR